MHMLLAMTIACLQRADAHTVASHADGIWTLLLRALDMRQCQLSGGSHAVHAADVEGVEAAVVEALLAAVLKLSETKFKPLFMRLLDWASSPPAATPGTTPFHMC